MLRTERRLSPGVIDARIFLRIRELEVLAAQTALEIGRAQTEAAIEQFMDLAKDLSADEQKAVIEWLRSLTS